MRLDRLLVYLRLAKTRSAACRLIDSRAMRRNAIRIQRANESVAVGDVLTLAWGSSVRVIEIVSLPTRRGSSPEARSHYRELGRDGDCAPGSRPFD